ncbi:somatomedin-B and thrombospondin type-1 domain-containing protein [Homalodisca vitripennis]|uniref:somatomedin-B and thrombospondin type-1 domain-containing protein n=1 Tax=Homalodisca vitripennis TaxID=197043 RepID=UPI001EEB9268|nr:somatomedin-B and thrombospondin type-1 domain-containing protein [Homalodisca vitripennis]
MEKSTSAAELRFSRCRRAAVVGGPRLGACPRLRRVAPPSSYIRTLSLDKVFQCVTMPIWPSVLLLLPFLCPVLGGSCGEARLCCKGRDSSCVVQKAPINAIIEDLDDRPCYCDHACLQLGDCCPDLKEACKVVDCEVSEWSSWGECNIDCGPGVMKRSRSVIRHNHNGGKHCPALVQKRGCLGTDCPHNPRSALKETAMLLPASLAFSRRSNETADITKNLRLRYPKDQLEEQRQEYCVQFKIMKASKGCRKVPDFASLREGEVKCVRCELQAMRKLLGYRCKGHGTMERATRWMALSAHQCHGQWVRLEHHHHTDDSCSNCPSRGDFIFI